MAHSLRRRCNFRSGETLSGVALPGGRGTWLRQAFLHGGSHLGDHSVQWAVPQKAGAGGVQEETPSQGKLLRSWSLTLDPIGLCKVYRSRGANPCPRGEGTCVLICKGDTTAWGSQNYIFLQVDVTPRKEEFRMV